MSLTTLLLILLLLSLSSYVFGRNRSLAVARSSGGPQSLHSLPSYYGYLTALWCGLPALIVLLGWLAFGSSIVTSLVLGGLPAKFHSFPQEQLDLTLNSIKGVASGEVPLWEVEPAIRKAATHYRRLETTSQAALGVIVLSVALGGFAMAWGTISPTLRARNRVERAITVLLVACSTIAIFTTIGIVLSVLFESILFFKLVPVSEFLFGLKWSPQMAIRADQVGSSGAFGAVPLFAGTLLISAIAMLVAVPVGLMTAIYLSEYASRRFRAFMKPLLEVLAGVPTVVYGFFAALTVAPLVRDAGSAIDFSVSSESALAAGLVIGIMIIPLVSSLSDDAMNAVPQAMRDGSYGLGATQSETIKQVVVPAALPGIVGGILLAVSRAIGETMVVVMAAGLAANLTMNPLDAVTTVTVQIATLLVGDQEFDSPKTLAAFALGLVLFMVTLVLNVIALHVVRKYREQYE